MDNGTIRSLSLSLSLSREEEGDCCKAGSNHSNNDEKRTVPCKEREQERAIRVPGKREYQNLVESQENSVPSFHFFPPSISSCIQTHWAIHPQENLATFGYRSQRKAENYY
jgi:hypothetical protein